MSDQRYIFTVTTGRSGTGYLTYILSLFSNISSFHESEPSFVECMRDVQSDRHVAEKFFREKKWAAIQKESSNRIYVDTTHLFCKGFLESWLEMGLPTPDLILLDRDFRKIALSLLKLNTIPGRSVDGLRWYLSPDDETCLTQLNLWNELNDYQLCYWYCLEIEARKSFYAEMIHNHGGLSARTSIEKLGTLKGILKLKRDLNLPWLSITGAAKYFKNRFQKVNVQGKDSLIYSDIELDAMEAEVKANTQ